MKEVHRNKTLAREAHQLIIEGKAEYRSWEHADPFTDATVYYAFIPETREYVDMGEMKPSGVNVIPGSLRGGRIPDFPPIYENIEGERI